ncbi:ABC transporter permease [Planctomicrobium sp. SH664]|uniref:ABC transporter permease n=1 Tax=Planctomicrobium sp. SH664 TaxID=3448125 RepID=UPI003F5B5A90
MAWIGFKMLFGDRVKLLGIVLGITFAALLIAQQASIFCGLMLLTTSAIRDLRDAPLWVMDSNMENIDNIKPLRDMDLQRVRGVPEIAWAVPFFKGQAESRLPNGDYRSVILLGVDDATLIGGPKKMIIGKLDDLWLPDAVIIDERGWNHLWPGEPYEVGRILEMNDKRARVVGVCKMLQTFQAFPIVFTRYSAAIEYIPNERRVMSMILADKKPEYSDEQAAAAVQKQTGLMCKTRVEFVWMTIWYYMRETGIPFNFGITVVLGFFVGTAIAGQTFYLFTMENLKQYAMLKAMGATNLRITFLVIMQAAVVGLIGYGLGVGIAALFGEFAKSTDKLAFYMPLQVLAGTGVAVTLIVTVASLLSLRRLLVLDPAEVFRA